MASITFWTRIEPFSRLDDIDTGLQAQTHDPLWLLARQWQTGEFQGEDAGTPVLATFRAERSPLARFRPGPAGKPEQYRSDVPLETLVEREAVQRFADPRRDLRIAADAGLYFLRLLERFNVSTAGRQAFAAAPGLQLPETPAAEDDDAGRRYLAVMRGRVPDGYRVYRALVPTLRPGAGKTPSLPPAPAIPAADRAKAVQAGIAFLEWFDARYSIAPAGAGAPSATPTWISERLEYSFAVSAKTSAGEVGLTATEYPGGALEWHSFDIDPGLTLGARPADPKPEPVVRTVVPAPVRYAGMAAGRFWELEDGQVNLNRIEGDPDELMRLLLVDFALAYGSDWFTIPVEVAPGALFRPQSLVVTDAFGERTVVPHYTASARPHSEWRLFALSSLPSSPPVERSEVLFLPPVLGVSLHGDPVEEVLFVRDELSNLVWAIERLAPSIAGGAVNRVEAYREPRPDPVAVPPVDASGDARYRLATTVPDYWIPFQPQRIDPAKPDVRLRRAAALIDEGGEPKLSQPLGRILEPERQDLSLFEEEVPRGGVRVVRRFEYTRWVDGSTFLWLARRKGAGTGEGSSGLRFDLIEEA
jgi:hypothetical protein